MLGAMGGMAAGPNGGRALNKLYYESMLTGPAQIANLAGNVGTLLTTPVMEAARGNVRGGIQLFREGVANPKAWGGVWDATKRGYRENRPVKYTNELPMGKISAGRALNAVDRATKHIMHQGGMSEEMAGHYTFTEDPVTELLKGLQHIQMNSPGTNKLTPFIRTMGKQLELGTAYSPLRHLPTGKKDGKLVYALKDTFPVENPLGTKSEWTNPFQYTAMLPAPLMAAAGAGLLPDEGPTSPTTSAIFGGLAAPYQVGRAYQDYQQHGRHSDSDMARATVQQIPIVGDLLKFIKNPTRFPSSVVQRFLPPALMAVGDRTVRDPRSGAGVLESVENSLKERLPWERESLPIRPNYFGEPDERTWFGGLPEPLYSRDPRAKALADMGLLRYQQSANLGDADLTGAEGSALKQARGQRMMQVLDPVLKNRSNMANIPDVLATLPPNQQALVEEMISARGMPRSEADFIRILQQLGIRLGTEEFKAKRLGALVQQTQGGQ